MVFFRGFPEFVQENAGVLLRMKPRWLSSTCFPSSLLTNHPSIIIYSVFFLVSTPRSKMLCYVSELRIFSIFGVELMRFAEINDSLYRAVFLNRRALASIIPDREGPEETAVCYKISLVQWLITNLNVILYLSTCHTAYISVLILFMIMP